MCDISRPWFGAGYPDCYCVDGYLHDADDDGYIPSDMTNPCPRCNTSEYLSSRKDHCDGTLWESWGTGLGVRTGDEQWEISKAIAREENPREADTLIAALEQRTG